MVFAIRNWTVEHNVGESMARLLDSNRNELLVWNHIDMTDADNDDWRELISSMALKAISQGALTKEAHF